MVVWVTASRAKRIAVSTLVLLGLTVSLQGQGPVPDSTNAVPISPALVEKLAAEMRASHPALKAAEARTNATAAEAAAVRTWEDPMIRLGGMAGPTMMRSEDGDIIYGIEQALPITGKPGATRRMVRAGVGIEAANLELRFQQLRADLAKTLLRAGLASEVVRIGTRDLEWLTTLTQNTEARYRSGQTGLPDFLRVQNETSLRKADLETSRDELRQAYAALNRLLNKPADTSWQPFALPEPGPAIDSPSNLLARALGHAPQSEVLRRQIDQGKYSVDLARKQKTPEFRAGVEGRNYSGDGEFRQGMFFLSMSVPWLNSGKYNKGIESQQHRVREMEFSLADYERGLQEQLEGLARTNNAALRRAIAYREEVLPRSASALESARAAWESGSGTFTDMLIARRQLLDAQLEYARSITAQYETLSDLGLLSGTPPLGDIAP